MRVRGERSLWERDVGRESYERLARARSHFSLFFFLFTLTPRFGVLNATGFRPYPTLGLHGIWSGSSSRHSLFPAVSSDLSAPKESLFIRLLPSCLCEMPPLTLRLISASWDWLRVVVVLGLRVFSFLSFFLSFSFFGVYISPSVQKQSFPRYELYIQTITH